MFPPELHMNLPEIYLKITWKFQASLAELLTELAWKSPEKYTWKVQVVFPVQVFLPEFHLKIFQVFNLKFKS